MLPRDLGHFAIHEFILVIIVTTCLITIGCSGSGDRPDIGEVTGVVTLDGSPVPGASIAFNKSGFRSSVGQTDDEGRYELIYIRDIRGAVIGEHEVRIKVFGARSQSSQQVPERYNTGSELTADVKPGNNVINFDLTSDPT